MNQGAWSSSLGRFKSLLRPEGAGASDGEDESVEAARGAGSVLAGVSGTLPDAVFDGYGDWYGYQDEWVLTHLAWALSPSEEAEILGLLAQDTPEALGQLLEYVDGRLGAWREAAREHASATAGAGGTLTGEANTANWQANRLPGTYYYAYTDGRYLYSDTPEAPAGEWAELPERERAAADQAQPWGESGWFYTPVADAGLYGGAYVYAALRDGPWTTQEQAAETLAQQVQNEGEPEMAVAADEDIESIMRELLAENPDFGELEEEFRREVVTRAVYEVLSEETAHEGRT